MVNLVAVLPVFAAPRRMGMYGEQSGPFAIVQWPYGEPGSAPFALIHAGNGYRVLSAQTAERARSGAGATGVAGGLVVL